jgi:hypothetical protein
MKLVVNCNGLRLDVPCGAGHQHVRWLGLAVASRVKRVQYPHSFLVPLRVTNNEGLAFKPRDVIREVLKDGEEVMVVLRQGATIPEDDYEVKEWFEEAYGPSSNLMECRIRWKQTTDPNLSQDIPKYVRGEFVVAPKWQGVYPQKEFGGTFELPIEPAELADGQFDWLSVRKGPPGSCTYKFVTDAGVEQVCKASPETMTPDKQAHYQEFSWDVPIAPEPYPEVDSRPSTASSRDGAQVDPRFEQDWESMRLKWVDPPSMKVRVKDVLTEFYAILVDLFDSYAFMGLDLSAAQHTIGMDDWRHLLINCELLEGQPDGRLPWSLACRWFEEAAGVRDGRPHLAQRLTRAHYLELLMRTACHAMCEYPKPQYATETGRPMPLDEGLFRFITDILIPVMDVYDEDPIRKDAVQQESLAAIQQNRPSIRSIYSFLAQPWDPCEGEGVVIPATLSFAFEYMKDQLAAAGDGGALAAGEEKKEGDADTTLREGFGAASAEPALTEEMVDVVLSTLHGAIAEITKKHPEPPEQRALFFWEFFEVMMQGCRELQEQLEVPLQVGIPAWVQTVLAFVNACDREEVRLPDPPDPGEAGFGEPAEGAQEQP